MTFPIHKCSDCGYCVFEGEPCAVCFNPERFFGVCAHGTAMNKVCVRCDAAIFRSQAAGTITGTCPMNDVPKADCKSCVEDMFLEFHRVMDTYKGSIPYRYAGALSECIQAQGRRLKKAEERAYRLQLVIVQVASDRRLLGSKELRDRLLNAVTTP